MPKGRITKLNPKTQKKICDALRAGNTRTASAAYAGIGMTTFHVWMDKGRRAKSGIHRDFRDAVEKAEADAEVRHVAIITKASEKSWQAAAWWLERRRHKDWRQRKDVDHGGQGGGAVPVRVVIGGPAPGGDGDDQ